MTFKHLCLFKIIEPLMIFVALGNFARFVFTSSYLTTSEECSSFQFYCSSPILTKVMFIPTFLPSFTFALVCLHVRLFPPLSLPFLSLTFLIDTKTARRVRQYSRRVVSFRLFRSRRGSVSLCALLIFLPLHYIRLSVYTIVYVCSLRLVYVSY